MFWVWSLTFFTGNMNLVMFLTGLLLGNSTTDVNIKVGQSPLQAWQQWEEYKVEFEKNYVTEEEERRRFDIFMENSRMIDDHNKLYDEGIYTYELGHNQFSDITHEEYLELFANSPNAVNDDDDNQNKQPTVKYNANPTLVDNQNEYEENWDDVVDPESKYNKDPTVKYKEHVVTGDERDSFDSNPIIKYDKQPTVKYDNEIGRMYNEEPTLKYPDAEEFDAIFNNPTVKYDIEYGDNYEEITFMPPANIELPLHIDWRNTGAVSGVKSEGHCSASWAFSATGALEGQLFRRNHHLVPLSEQNLVDCSRKFGNHGCKNGTSANAYRYIMYNGGINTNITYPWRGKQLWTCHYKRFGSNPRVRGITHIQSGNETALVAAVATVGPISVAIDARSNKFRFYKSGIFYDPHCSSHQLNREMLVVGYGHSFWIVKNSWSRRWGASGYMFMTKNGRNHCGIATRAIFPIV